jgi:exonuclease SbcD
VPLRSLFEGAKFDTLIVPGNHDAEAFQAGLYFGERVQVLSNPDWSKNVVEYDEARVIGIPFEVMGADEFYRSLRGLRSVLDPDRTNILLYHGELLDASFDREAFGPERGRYMPSRLAYFAELGVDYVLGGHFHSNFDVREFREGGFFVYSGSPVSITRRETGRRHAALIEPGKAPEKIPLNTHHFEQVNVMLDAFADEDPLEKINSALEGVHPKATVLLTVDGTIRGAEQELVEAINEATNALQVEVRSFGFRDLSRIVGHPVFTLFESRLKELEKLGEDPLDPEQAEALWQLAIRAMTEAGV